MPPGAFAAATARGGPAGGPAAGRAPAPCATPHWTDPVAVAAQEAQRARSPERSDLSSARLLRNTKRPPQSGWRRMIYVLSGRMFNPGESPTDIRRRQLTARVNQPLLGCYKIAMLSLKGGVGKTTMTATLGATFASLRGDRVVAVDANPDRGTLSQKIPLETSATVRNLLRDSQRVRRYTDVRAYTSQGPSRLEVLASEQDPAVSEAYSEDDYRRTVNLLEHFYNIVLTDCGTGLMHSAMYGVLGVADQLVIVSSGSIDGARSASATMDWLDAHGHGDLVANAVVVINFVHRSRGGVDLDRVSEHFAARCRSRWCASRSTRTSKKAPRSISTGWSRTPAWRCSSSRPTWRMPSSACTRSDAGKVRQAGLPDGARARRADAGTRDRRPGRSPGDGSDRGAGRAAQPGIRPVRCSSPSTAPGR